MLASKGSCFQETFSPKIDVWEVIGIRIDPNCRSFAFV
jgi:hypothetical protein